jgi:hypothetical protein
VQEYRAALKQAIAAVGDRVEPVEATLATIIPSKECPSLEK